MKNFVFSILCALFAASGFGATWQSQAAVTDSWTSSTAAGFALQITTQNYATVTVSIQSSMITNGAVAFEASDDGTSWYLVSPTNTYSATYEVYSGLAGPGQTSAPMIRSWQWSCAGYQSFRVRLVSAVVGTGTAAIRIQSSSAPSYPSASVAKYSDPNDGWSVLNMYLTKRSLALR